MARRMFDFGGFLDRLYRKAHLPDDKPKRRPVNRPLRSRWLPTAALPGTSEKMDIMAERAENRLPLFHPRDAKMEDVQASDWLKLLFGECHRRTSVDDD